jgi:hypothetical protein
MRWTFVPLILCVICCNDGSSAVVNSASTDVATEFHADTGPGPDDATATTDDTNTEDTNTIEDDTTSQVLNGEPCLNPGTPGATATCLQPTMTPEYYVEQANKYFDTLDLNAEPGSMPYYSEQVVRWEWPPWLLLTGLGKQDMIDTAEVLKVGDPSTVPERDCRFFETQPFARCYVVFEYEGGPCPIYEEFVFNDAGEMTFIEAWSDLPGLRPQQGEDDRFGERGTFYRLSTRVPGLGTPEGSFDLESEYMLEASAKDEHVADFALRATNWWSYWFDLLNSSPEDFFAQGCGWPTDSE